MKNLTRTILILIISILLASISAAFSNNSSNHAGLAGYSNAAFFYQTTVTPLPTQDRSEVGSTDGITLISFIIVAIIIIPIVLKRKSWSQF